MTRPADPTGPDGPSRRRTDPDGLLGRTPNPADPDGLGVPPRDPDDPDTEPDSPDSLGELGHPTRRDRRGGTRFDGTRDVPVPPNRDDLGPTATPPS